MEQPREIWFTFRGKMADFGQMNFYELGRFQYASARLLYGLEVFRQTGLIPDRLTRKVNVDLRVSTPERGSFINEIVVMAAPIVADHFLQISLQQVLSHVMGLLLPVARARDVAVELEKERTAQEAERTKQEQEKTKQLGVVAESGKSSDDVTRMALQTAQMALEELRAGRQREAYVSVADLSATRDEVAALESVMRSEVSRQEDLKLVQDELAKINPDLERRLLTRTRAALKDFVIPFRDSADYLRIGSPANQSRYAYLDEKIVNSIVGEKLDKDPTDLYGAITMYDVESGYGRFRIDESPRALSLRVPSALRSLYRPQLADSLKKDATGISAYVKRDKFGNPTSLLFDRFIN